MNCRICNGATEGINVLCHQCQLDMVNDFIADKDIIKMANKYRINPSTVMNMLKYYGAL